MTTITLKQLRLGKTDAKNELIYDSDDEKRRFVAGFHRPPNVQIDHFLSGSRYFVTGMKGTGKTALLRYLAICAERDQGVSTSFILFKSEFSEDDKEQFALAGRALVVKNNIDQLPGNDFQAAWRWFIYRHIVKVAEEKSLSVAKRDANWKKFVECVTAPNVGSEESGIARILPRLKKGSVEISSSPKLGIEFEWEDKDKTTVAFNKFARQADELFSRLVVADDTLHVFLDELELSMGDQHQQRRDASIISDLILAIDKINRISRKNSLGVLVFAAIRSEVLGAIGAVGKEVNKIIADFGTLIAWDVPGNRIDKHPLLQMIVQRLRVSEQYAGESSDNKTDEQLWNKYFPATVHGKDSRKYVLQRSWYRPRDVVRLLNIACEQFPEERTFSAEVLLQIRKRYSTDSWVEFSEELSASYKDVEIKGIKQLLTKIPAEFTVAQFAARFGSMREMYPNIDELSKNHKPPHVLSDLYRIGVIGNVKPAGGGQNHYRYAYRGDDDPSFEFQFCVHQGLMAVFSID